ncbi:MAG: hypothetical protein ACMG6E_08220 [Candidatus Roizmanbacteria bacterium]
MSQESNGKGHKIVGKTNAKILQEEDKEEEKVEQKRAITID